MGYIGSDPVRNDSVSTAQLADDAVTNPKIVDDIAFSNVTASNHISASGTGSFGSVHTAGHVSIGTGSHEAKLNVYHNVNNEWTALFTQDYVQGYGVKITGDMTGTDPLLKIMSEDTNTRFRVQGDGKVGIKTNSPTYTLDVAGDAGFDEYIYHNGDTDTFIRFEADKINIETGGENMIYVVEGGGGAQANKVTINNDLADVDFQVKGDNDANLFRTDAVKGTIGVGTGSANNKLEVHGDFYATGSISGSITTTGSFGAVNVAGMTNSNLVDVSSSFSTRVSNLKTDSGSISTRLDNSEASGALLNQDLKTSASPTFVNVTATGTMTAQEFHTEFVSASIVYDSGSTKFGDDIDDNHSFSGSIQQSGSFTSTHAIKALGISLSNNDSGTSNTIFGKNAGLSLDAGSNYNVFIGEDVSDAAMDDAINNVGVGYQALSGLEEGDKNVAIGYQSLLANTDGSSNVAVGIFAGDANLTGDSNVWVGRSAGGGATDVESTICIGRDAGAGVLTSAADGTIAIGRTALATHTTGERNMAIGHAAMADTDAGSTSLGSSDNIFIGYQSGGGTWADAASTYNVGIGNYSMDAVMNGAVKHTAVGHGALGAITSADQNVGIGYDAGNDLTTGTDNVIIGHQAGDKTSDVDQAIIIGSDAGGANITNNADGTILIGYKAGWKLTSGASNTAIGYLAMVNNTTGQENTYLGYAAGSGSAADPGVRYNTGIGFKALAEIRGGDANTAVGRGALEKNTSGGSNTALGYGTMNVLLDGDQNVAIGRNAMNTGTHTSMNFNTVVGAYAGDAFTSAAIEHCTLIGAYAGSGALTIDALGTTAVGSNALLANSSGAGNTAVGYAALKQLAAGTYNTALGYNAMTNLEIQGTVPSGNVAIGYGAADAFEDGESYNIAIGMNAMGAWQEGNANCNNNVCIGTGAGFGGDVGAGGANFLDNIAIGHEALDSGAIPNASMQGTIAIGSGALGALSSGAKNTVIGYNAGATIVTGHSNTVLGYNALSDQNAGNSSNDSDYNTAIGMDSMKGAWTDTKSEYNTAVGANTMKANMNGANQNTAIGYGAGDSILGGGYNTAIGTSAGCTIDNGNKNTLIGYNCQTTAGNTETAIVLGSETTSGANSTCRIGNTNGYAELTLDGSDTSWAAGSDIRLKENVNNSIIGLDFINELRPITYNWKKKKDVPSDMPKYKEGSDEPYNGTEVKTLYGFVAQEVKEIIDKYEVSDGQSIWSEDPSGVQQVAEGALMTMMVKAVQELSTKVEEQAKRIEELEG